MYKKFLSRAKHTTFPLPTMFLRNEYATLCCLLYGICDYVNFMPLIIPPHMVSAWRRRMSNSVWCESWCFFLVCMDLCLLERRPLEIVEKVILVRLPECIHAVLFIHFDKDECCLSPYKGSMYSIIMATIGSQDVRVIAWWCSMFACRKKTRRKVKRTT